MDDLSEKEQIERLRAWWRENGNYVLIGIVVGLGLLFGVNQWRAKKLETELEASTRFESLAESVGNNRLEQAETIAGEIHRDFGDTIYSDQAHLAMARLYMDQGRDQDAADELQALLEGAVDENMRLLARLRLARVLLYQDRAEEVIALVEGHTDNAFAPRLNEVLGDAYFELGRFDDAEAAYLAVVTDERASQLVDVDLVQMKINDLPEDGAAAEEGAPAPAGPEAEEGTDATESPSAESADDEPAAEGEDPVE